MIKNADLLRVFRDTLRFATFLVTLASRINSCNTVLKFYTGCQKVRRSENVRFNTAYTSGS